MNSKMMTECSDERSSIVSDNTSGRMGDHFHIQLLAAMIVLAVLVSAFTIIGSSEESDADVSGECGYGVKYTLNDSSGLLEITFDTSYTGEKAGEMYDFIDTEEGGPPWYGKTVKNVKIGEGVKSVGKYAFKQFGVESVELSSTVEEIHDFAFAWCDLTELTTINVKSIGECAFFMCEKLKTVILGEGLVTIGDEAFNACYNIKTLTIPSSVTYINEYAFVAQSFLTLVESQGKWDFVEKTAENLRGQTWRGNISTSILTAPSYDITLKMNDGTEEIYVVIWTMWESKLPLLPEPTRPGYYYTGWYDAKEGGEKITADTVFTHSTVIYAHWSTEPPEPSSDCLVTIEAGIGGYVDHMLVTVPSGTTYSAVGHELILDTSPVKVIKAVAEPGFKLSSWSSTKGTVTSDMTIEVSFVEGVEIYTIFFDADGGKPQPGPITTDVDGKLASLPTVSRSGYNFEGWYLSDGVTKVTTNTVFTSDTTVYAHWSAVYYGDDDEEAISYYQRMAHIRAIQQAQQRSNDIDEEILIIPAAATAAMLLALCMWLYRRE